MFNRDLLKEILKSCKNIERYMQKQAREGVYSNNEWKANIAEKIGLVEAPDSHISFREAKAPKKEKVKPLDSRAKSSKDTLNIILNERVTGVERNDVEYKMHISGYNYGQYMSSIAYLKKSGHIEQSGTRLYPTEDCLKAYGLSRREAA